MRYVLFSLGWLVIGWLTFRGVLVFYKPTFERWYDNRTDGAKSGWRVYLFTEKMELPTLLKYSLFIWPVLIGAGLVAGAVRSANKFVTRLSSRPFIPKQYTLPPIDSSKLLK